MQCVKCGIEFKPGEVILGHYLPHHFVCPSEAERSEAPAGGPPSATGSAGAGAADEAGADSSGRSAEANGRLLVELEDSIERLLEIVEGVRGERWQSNGRRLVDTPEWCAFYVAHHKCKAADAPQRSVERVRLPNDALCHPAGSGHGAQGNDPKNL